MTGCYSNVLIHITDEDVEKEQINVTFFFRISFKAKNNIFTYIN